jgi:hypothetical protein
MWEVGYSEPGNQANAVFETWTELGGALSRLVVLKQTHPTAYVWATGDFYAVAARLTERGKIGFVVCPTTETDSEPPESCRPFSASELLELNARDDTVLPAEEECPTCGLRRRGRYANVSVSGYPLFVCSSCDQWTETLPTTAPPGERLRPSDMAQ